MRRAAVLDHVAEVLRPYAGSRLVVAVSGGLDSVSLLDMLVRLQSDLKLELVIAHFDHGLRRGSGRDAEFVTKLATGYTLPLATKRVAVGSGSNLEARAREARYAWLESVRAKHDADYVVTAHQADDQVETLLLHLARGSGLQGLTGMRSERDRLLRPLLGVPRRTLTRYVRGRRLTYRKDPTNEKLHYARNRVRHRVITALERLNPQLIETVSQSMRVLADEYDVLQQLAQHDLDRIRTRRGEVWKLENTKLKRLRRARRHLVWREALREIQGNLVGIKLRHIENLDLLLAGKSGDRIHLPGELIAVREYDAVVLRTVATSQPPRLARWEVPGQVRFGEVTLVAKTPGKPGVNAINVNAATVGGTLQVRSPKPGDRFQPVGMRGSKLVSDVLTDAKVPRDERPWVPIVTTARGQIIWIVGHRADRRFIAQPEQKSLTLRLK